MNVMKLDTEYVNCLKCGGRGYRVKWQGAKASVRPCATCAATGKQKEVDSQ